MTSIEVTRTFQLPPLYRVGGNGKTYVWVISFDGQELLTHWETIEKFNAGIIQSSRRRVDLNSRSIGIYEQALQEAQHEHKNKKDKQGYGEQVVQHDIYSMPAMLCTTWDPAKNQIKRWPVWTFPKLDGCRCRMHINPSDDDSKVDTIFDVQLVSRATQVIHNLNHIRMEFLDLNEKIKTVIRNTYPTIIPLVRVDGELYCSELTFDQISGITRLVREVSPVEGYLKYYVFDLMLTINVPFNLRYRILQQAFEGYESKFIYLLEGHSANNKHDIMISHETYVAQGYEGVIIRKVGGTTEAQQAESYYRGTRCTAIYKYKNFQDAEGVIVGAEASNGGHEDGGVIWLVRDAYGRSFSVRPKGDVNTRKALYQSYLQNPQAYNWQKYRYRFQDLTQEGKPRFPVGIGFVYDR